MDFGPSILLCTLAVLLMAISRQGRHILLSLVILLGLLLTIESSKLLSQYLLGSNQGLIAFSAESKSEPAWFLAHPVLSILGSVTIPVPAVILRKYKGYWSKKIHAYMFGLSIIAITMGIYVVFTSKRSRGKSHLASLHAQAAAVLVILYAVVAIIGVIALDPDYAFISDRVRKTLLKWIHKTGGRILVILGVWVCFSGWAKFFDGATLYGGAAIAAIASLLTYVDPLVSRVWPDSKNE